MQFGAALPWADDAPLRSYPREPEPMRYTKSYNEPHQRGGLLASAFLEAFLGAYRERTRTCCGSTAARPRAATSTPTSSGG